MWAVKCFVNPIITRPKIASVSFFSSFLSLFFVLFKIKMSVLQVKKRKREEKIRDVDFCSADLISSLFHWPWFRRHSYRRQLNLHAIQADGFLNRSPRNRSGRFWNIDVNLRLTDVETCFFPPCEAFNNVGVLSYREKHRK